MNEPRDVAALPTTELVVASLQWQPWRTGCGPMLVASTIAACVAVGVSWWGDINVVVLACVTGAIVSSGISATTWLMRRRHGPNVYSAELARRTAGATTIEAHFFALPHGGRTTVWVDLGAGTLVVISQRFAQRAQADRVDSSTFSPADTAALTRALADVRGPSDSNARHAVKDGCPFDIVVAPRGLRWSGNLSVDGSVHAGWRFAQLLRDLVGTAVPSTAS